MNTAILARPAADGFEGRSVPVHGDVEELLLQLQETFRTTFHGDLDALTAHFLDDQNDGEPTWTEANAHDADAESLLLMEVDGVACFRSEVVDGRPVWTWTGKRRWSAS